MADPLELGLNVGGGRDIAVLEVAEVELHPGLQAPVERDLVDGGGAFPFVHGRMVVPWRVDVRAVVSGEMHALNRPSLASPAGLPS